MSSTFSRIFGLPICPKPEARCFSKISGNDLSIYSTDTGSALCFLNFKVVLHHHHHHLESVIIYGVDGLVIRHVNFIYTIPSVA